METAIMSLEERRNRVLETLRPDTIRNHQVSDSLIVDASLVDQLGEQAQLAAAFATGMSQLSQVALEAGSGDVVMRTIRRLFCTESRYQAQLRGEIALSQLPDVEITKVDTILTSDGFRIVEIEPGKIRGLGYGHMVRSYAAKSVGLGADTVLSTLSENQPTGILLSTTDRFHEPEIAILATAVKNILAIPQSTADIDRTGRLRQRYNGIEVSRVLMMSKLEKQYSVNEGSVRNAAKIVSDRREDLESKGALALLHNMGDVVEIEQVLVSIFGEPMLRNLRRIIPPTIHSSLISEAEVKNIQASVRDDDLGLYLKPLTDSGTRGIITPNETDKIIEVFDKAKLLGKYVLQRAEPSVVVTMNTMDVLSGEAGEADMILRITLHVDRNGNIIETSVVGSPHHHLAHGGKSSVITNLERKLS